MTAARNRVISPVTDGVKTGASVKVTPVSYFISQMTVTRNAAQRDIKTNQVTGIVSLPGAK